MIFTSKVTHSSRTKLMRLNFHEEFHLENRYNLVSITLDSLKVFVGNTRPVARCSSFSLSTYLSAGTCCVKYYIADYTQNQLLISRFVFMGLSKEISESLPDVKASRSETS